MLFGGKDKDKKDGEDTLPATNPGALINLVVRIAALVLIGYAFFQYITGEPPRPVSYSGTLDSADGKLSKADNCFCLPSPENRFFGSLLPAITPNMAYEVISEGDGKKAVCGQEVQVNVSPSGESYFAGEINAPFSFRAGAGKTLRGLELGVLDMNVGDEFRLHIPPQYAYLHSEDPAVPKNEKVLLETELLATQPEPPQGSMPMRAFMTNVGGGAYAKCGDRVAVQLDLWSPQGGLLFSTRLGEGAAGPLTFTIGMGQVPFALEQALLRMRVSGEWSFILPSSLMERFNPPQGIDAESFPLLLSQEALPKSDVVIADLVLIEIIGYDPSEAAKQLLPMLFGDKENVPVQETSPVEQEADKNSDNKIEGTKK